MDYQTIQLNKNKRIGRVVYVVEGNKTEHLILKRVYQDILGYNYIGENRDGVQMKFTKSKDKYSVVYVLNSKNSNISSIQNSNELGDYINDFITNNYDKDFRLNNAAIFYLFDRDYKSNKNYVVEDLLKKYTNSRESNLDFENQGLLLLSYPSIEAFLAENFLNKYHKYYFDLGRSIKSFLKHKHIRNKITENSLKKGVFRTHKMLETLEIQQYNIDNFYETNKLLFDKQEHLLETQKGYKLISMLSMSLIDLGIIDVK